MIGAASMPPRVSLGTIDLLLRDRAVMLARIRNGDVGGIVRTMTATIAVAMAIVGAALGSYRGDQQIAYAAIKLPLVLLGTAALSAPALTAVGAALGRPARLASDLALVMAALAYGSLLLCACTPLLMLGRAIELGYHEMILLAVVVFAVAGLAAIHMIVRALATDRDRGWRISLAALCAVLVLVGSQLAWALRPYLVRPRAHDVVFVRGVEDSLIDAIGHTIQSARGEYYRDEAPLPEGAGEP